MNFASPPLQGAVPVSNPRTAVADTRAVLTRAPEWPRLTRREVRQIVLDFLG